MGLKSFVSSKIIVCGLFAPYMGLKRVGFDGEPGRSIFAPYMGLKRSR